MPPKLVELLQHLEHCSAEINTAVREGMYVQMGVPTINYGLTVKEITLKGGTTIDLELVENIDYDFDLDVRLNYEVQPLDPARVKRVDHRDALSKRRNPDYQPPQGAS